MSESHIFGKDSSASDNEVQQQPTASTYSTASFKVVQKASVDAPYTAKLDGISSVKKPNIPVFTISKPASGNLTFTRRLVNPIGPSTHKFSLKRSLPIVLNSPPRANAGEFAMRNVPTNAKSPFKVSLPDSPSISTKTSPSRPLIVPSSSVLPGILRSPSQVRRLSKFQTKPIILNSNFMMRPKVSSNRIVPRKILPLSFQSKVGMAESSGEERATRKAMSSSKGGSFIPTGGANSRGPTTISIVTGKGTFPNKAISLIPLAGTNKTNMVNLKIANGRIQNETMPMKIDNMTSVCERPSSTLPEPVQANSLLSEELLKKGSEDQLLDLEENCSTTFAKVETSDSKPKDILEEAMCAMASDGFTGEDLMDLELSAESRRPRVDKPSTDNQWDPPSILRKVVDLPFHDQLPILVPTSVPCSLPPPVLLQNLQTHVNIPVSSQESSLQLSSLEEKLPNISITFPNKLPEVPGLIIRTDSVTVRRRLCREEERKEALKPDLSIIPILRNSSLGGDKSFSQTSPQKLVLGSLDDPSVSAGRKEELPTKPLKATEEDADLSKLLKWENGEGCLAGSDLRFRWNEFSALELVENEALDELKRVCSSREVTPPPLERCTPVAQSPSIHIHHARKPSHHKRQEVSTDIISDSDSLSKGGRDIYDICCCKNCGCYGLNSEFFMEKGNSFCTTACSEDFETKETEWNREKMRLERNKNRARRGRSKERENAEVGGVLEPRLCDTQKPQKEVFSWVKYLEMCGKAKGGLSRAAPLKLWQEPFPFGKNLFKVGMKLEGIDPQHQSLFCVMTVADVIGHRIRLHFDGYSDCYDFWCNANSPNLFQVGWCERNGRKLESPPSVINFNWKAYLEHCRAAPAMRQAFSTANSSTILIPSNFRIGMKLEAEDRKNGWTCVATVADLLDNRILVHFDGWDKVFDTWFDINSPFIHPVGWCAENGVYLFAPKDFNDPECFSWHEYLQETNSVAVPARAFKARPARDFKTHMKVEAVDRRNTMLVRVATIADTKNYKILLHFDGWSDEYDYWTDDESPDVHPPLWCSKTGHSLQPPLPPESSVNKESNCGSVGCRGYGHIKGLLYGCHHTSYGCPYSKENLDKDVDSLLPDRLNDKKREKLVRRLINLDSSKPTPDELEDLRKKRVRKRRRFFDELTPPANSKVKMPRVSSDEMKAPVGAKPTVVSFASSSNEGSRLSTPSGDSDKRSSQNTDSLDVMIHRSVFNPPYNPKPGNPHPLALEKYKLVTGISKSEVESWTEIDVKQFISSISGCSSLAKRFLDHKVDGKSLLMLTQRDLVELLRLKLGPAVKIMAALLSVKYSPSRAAT